MCFYRLDWCWSSGFLSDVTWLVLCSILLSLAGWTGFYDLDVVLVVILTFVMYVCVVWIVGAVLNWLWCGLLDQ